MAVDTIVIKTVTNKKIMSSEISSYIHVASGCGRKLTWEEWLVAFLTGGLMLLLMAPIAFFTSTRTYQVRMKNGDIKVYTFDKENEQLMHAFVIQEKQ